MSDAKREEINEEGTIQDALVLLSEREPGAVSVQKQLLETDFELGLATIMLLDDMNIRGAQIWCAFNYCENSLTRLVLQLKRKPQDLVDHVNENGRRFKEWPHLSVTSSAKGNRQFL